MTDKKIDFDNIKVDNDFKSISQEESVSDALNRLEEARMHRVEMAPTDDNDVRKVLRMLEEPEQLVNEDEKSRRERLGELLYANRAFFKKYQESLGELGEVLGSNNNSEQEESEDESEFYTPADESLKTARRFLIKYSIKKSKERLSRERSNARTLKIQEILSERRTLNAKLTKFQLVGSQVASTRPISRVAVAPNKDYFAAASWAGDIKVFKIDSLHELCEIKTHDGKIGGLDWNIEGSLLVNGSEGGLVKINKYANDVLGDNITLRGHEKRVVTTKFHPSNLYVGSASFDTTWRLWDVEKSIEVQLQEGHSKEVYSLSFHKDGSLVCTGSFDNSAILWDIRSGKAISILQGHAKPIYSVDWSADGHTVATGGGDGLINVWDIRKPDTAATPILAHNNIVSDLHFDQSYGNCLISCGYDKIINIYSSANWNKITKLEGHSDKILCVDVSSSIDRIISAGWDRSVKLWSVSI